MRLLFLLPGPLPPPADSRRDRFLALSEQLEGDVILPVWWRTETEIQDHLGPGAGTTYTVGRFTYHLDLNYRHSPRWRKAAALRFLVQHGAKLLRERPYDVVVSYGTGSTGVCARVFKEWFGIPLITELPGAPNRAPLFEERSQPWKHFVGERTLNLVLRGTDHVRLFYPTQLESLPQFRPLPSSVFHEFVPVSVLPRDTGEEGYLLFLGYPWRLKGVDILLKAFQKISSDFPEISLKVVGHCEDRTPYEALRAKNPRIEFYRGVRQEEAHQLIAKCTALVLPSRTESMGRVLLEAMAMKKPVIASAVDGIPHYIEHERTGLLFASEQVNELAHCLRRLLTDPALRERLATDAHRTVFERYSEHRYVENFAQMVHEAKARG